MRIDSNLATKNGLELLVKFGLLVDHPAYDHPESRAIHHEGYENVAADRQGVVNAWTDSKVLHIIADRGIQLVSYGDVRQGKLG